jgi:hypothetical protein
MAAQQACGVSAILFAYGARPPPAPHSPLLNEAVELHFMASRQRIFCTKGDVAEGLAARLAQGARSLAEALRNWLLTDQA